MTPEAAQQMVEDCAAKLREHFDCVQILASYEDGPSTQIIGAGEGNWFGRLGMAQHMIDRERAREIADQMPTL